MSRRGARSLRRPWLLQLRFQICVNQGVQTAVEHPLGVASLKPRSQVLDLSVRLKHVRSNLVTEIRADVFTLQFGGAGFRLDALELGEARGENGPRELPIANLRPLVPANGGQSRGKVG